MNCVLISEITPQNLPWDYGSNEVHPFLEAKHVDPGDLQYQLDHAKSGLWTGWAELEQGLATKDLQTGRPFFNQAHANFAEVSTCKDTSPADRFEAQIAIRSMWLFDQYWTQSDRSNINTKPFDKHVAALTQISADITTYLEEQRREGVDDDHLINLKGIRAQALVIALINRTRDNNMIALPASPRERAVSFVDRPHTVTVLTHDGKKPVSVLSAAQKQNKIAETCTIHTRFDVIGALATSLKYTSRDDRNRIAYAISCDSDEALTFLLGSTAIPRKNQILREASRAITTKIAGYPAYRAG